VDEEENWLHGEQIQCSHCHQRLYRVDHSPFYDEYFLYCSRCPTRVEVGYYDPVFQQVDKLVRQTSKMGEKGLYAALMQAVEAHLKPCHCCGNFYHDAPRRCFRCHMPVISENPDGIDLFPEWMDNDSPDDLSEQEERWLAQFVRAEDIWQESSI
jgi:hypothetical protein